jgi:hypothetical protein
LSSEENLKAGHTAGAKFMFEVSPKKREFP